MTSEEITQLAESFADSVYGFCLRLTKNVHEAEELCQDTFLKAVEKPDKIDKNNNPRAYLCTVALSLWKSRIRKLVRRQKIAPCAPIDDYISVSDGKTVEDTALARERAQCVNNAVNALPEKLRVPVLLYYMCDMPLTDISNALGCPEGTVKSRLHTAREIIKKDLEALLNE